mmetsp:Transcript_7473/g.12630  ORF Transcript_7473/g.12630 Transcript_7473/m.12630 type:complete len:246 (-) Transcript_7473:72-809(-)
MCSEAKWLRQTGLVLLLPHGFDGAGPEHSTAHIERFLQNVNSNVYKRIPEVLTHQRVNFQVAQCTTPANYFHILRRQQLRDYRKPLVLATPKIGLKHPMAYSPLEDMGPATAFQSTITNWYGEETRENKADKIILCSGKVFFDIHSQLSSEEAKASGQRFQVLRLEELAPFPTQKLMDEIFNNLADQGQIYYVQEEPANQGAFQFTSLHVGAILQKIGLADKQLNYIGRDSMHSFCSGSPSIHKE